MTPLVRIYIYVYEFSSRQIYYSSQWAEKGQLYFCSFWYKIAYKKKGEVYDSRFHLMNIKCNFPVVFFAFLFLSNAVWLIWKELFMNMKWARACFEFYILVFFSELVFGVNTNAYKSIYFLCALALKNLNIKMTRNYSNPTIVVEKIK